VVVDCGSDPLELTTLRAAVDDTAERKVVLNDIVDTKDAFVEGVSTTAVVVDAAAVAVVVWIFVVVGASAVVFAFVALVVD
jgi:hypothetical protein